MKKILFLSFFTLVFVQCGSNEELPSYAVDAAYTEEAPVADMVNRTSQEPIAPIDQKIIKTGNFTFETLSVVTTYNQVKKLVEDHKGYIQNDQISNSYDRITRSLTIRIPHTGFHALIDSLSKKVTVFDEQHINMEDVTEEFYDIEARTKTKKELESRYLQLLSKAGNIKDMLEIERQLATIREEIEVQEGRMKYLQNKVAYSTINLTFYEVNEVKKSPSNSFVSRIGKGFKGGFNGILDFVVILFYNWPLILVLIPTIWYIRKKRAERKNLIKQDK